MHKHKKHKTKQQQKVFSLANKFKNAKTSTGKPLTPSMIDYIFRLNLPAQKVDQELVDTVSKYMEKKVD